VSAANFSTTYIARIGPEVATGSEQSTTVSECLLENRDPLSPPRTGDADFPRPALLKTLASSLHRPRFGRTGQTNQTQRSEVSTYTTPLRSAGDRVSDCAAVDAGSGACARTSRFPSTRQSDTQRKSSSPILATRRTHMSLLLIKRVEEELIRGVRLAAPLRLESK
jgi:hypothetical protein